MTISREYKVVNISLRENTRKSALIQIPGVISNNGKLKHEIKATHRTAAARKFFHTQNGKFISKQEVPSKIHQRSFKSKNPYGTIPAYGSESWT